MSDATDTATTATAVHAAATCALEEDWGPLAEATGGAMQTHGTQMWTDGTADCGIWEATPGPSAWVMAQNEMIAILGGRMTVTAEDGMVTELGAGDCMFFPKGWKGTWLITQTIRKAYALF